MSNKVPVLKLLSYNIWFSHYFIGCEQAHDGGVVAVELSRVMGSAPQLITIGADKTLAIWDTMTFKVYLLEVKQHFQSITDDFELYCDVCLRTDNIKVGIMLWGTVIVCSYCHFGPSDDLNFPSFFCFWFRRAYLFILDKHLRWLSLLCLYFVHQFTEWLFKCPVLSVFYINKDK